MMRNGGRKEEVGRRRWQVSVRTQTRPHAKVFRTSLRCWSVPRTGGHVQHSTITGTWATRVTFVEKVKVSVLRAPGHDDARGCHDSDGKARRCGSVAVR